MAAEIALLSSEQQRCWETLINALEMADLHKLCI